MQRNRVLVGVVDGVLDVLYLVEIYLQLIIPQNI